MTHKRPKSSFQPKFRAGVLAFAQIPRKNLNSMHSPFSLVSHSFSILPLNGPRDGWLDLHTFQEHLCFYLLFLPCPTCCFKSLYQIFICIYFLALTYFIVLSPRVLYFMKPATFPQPHEHSAFSLLSHPVKLPALSSIHGSPCFCLIL